MRVFILTVAMFVSIFGLHYQKQVDKFNFAIHHLSQQTQKTEKKCLEGGLTTQEIVDLSNAFKATLSATQLATTQLEYNLPNAAQWSNFPVTFANAKRLGIRFGDLNATQLAAAKTLIKAASGTTEHEGYAEIEQLWAADQYLGANGGGDTYGNGQYYIAFLGNPSMTGTWELQTGGHHLAFANTYKNGILIGATPSFRAAEPFGAFQNGDKLVQPLLQDRDALVAILTGLSTAEQATAQINSVFRDILLGPGKDWQFPTTKVGIKASSLTAAQKSLIIAAIKTYVQDIDDTNAALILQKYTKELDDTYIAFSGTPTLTTQNDYIRIDGPSVWIEYSSQGGIVIRNALHPHSVWRDRKTDYGGQGNITSTAEVATVIASVSNYPNPATNITTIDLQLLNTAEVAICIYNTNGQRMATAYQGTLPSGKHAISLDVSGLNKGVYMYSIQTNEKGIIKTMSKKLVKR
jgi:Protein of unknown function (DUF3500)/Secretion system C-terminal sorting domain